MVNTSLPSPSLTIVQVQTTTDATTANTTFNPIPYSHLLRNSDVVIGQVENLNGLAAAVGLPNISTAKSVQPQPLGPTGPLKQGSAGLPQNAQSKVSQPPLDVAPVSQPQPPVNPTVQNQQPVTNQYQNFGIPLPGSAQVPIIKPIGLPTTSIPAPRPPASSVAPGQPSQQQLVSISTITQPPAATLLSVATQTMDVSQPTQNIKLAQPVPSVAQPAQSLGQIGQSVATMPFQNLAQPAQSLPHNSQKFTKTVPSVAQQDCTTSRAVQSDLSGMTNTSLSSPSLTTDAPIYTSFYPIPHSHLMCHVGNLYGLVEAREGQTVRKLRSEIMEASPCLAR